MLIFSALLSGLYILFVSLVIWGWRGLKKKQGLVSQKTGPKLSVIIPFRNEAYHLEQMLPELYMQLRAEFVHFDMALIDDSSSDQSAQLVKAFIDQIEGDVKLLSSEGLGKMDAIKMGLLNTKYPSILSLDADIALPKGWAKELKRCLLEYPDADMIVLPIVGQVQKDNWITRYAALDTASLVAVSLSSTFLKRPLMVNAAHMVYNRKYALIDENIVSGDDQFLLERIKEDNGIVKTSWHPSLLVQTIMPSSWKSLLMQRLRWASKSSAYTDPWLIGLGLFISVLNVSIWALFLMSFHDMHYLSLFLLIMSTRVVMDVVLFDSIKTDLNLEYKRIDVLSSSFINSLFFVLVFLLHRLLPFRWKGRRYKAHGKN